MAQQFRGAYRVLSLALCILGISAQQLYAQQANAAPAQKAPGVEQISAMLNAIDPYRTEKKLSGSLAIFGSTSMDVMADHWASGLKDFHQGLKIEISGLGSEAAFAKLAENPSGVAMLSRPVKAEELQALKQKGLKEPRVFRVAKEALGVFVNAKNPVQTITGEQLRDLFTETTRGDLLKWGQIGGTGVWAEKDIHIISRVPQSGTQKFLQDFVFAKARLKAGVSKHASNAEVVAAIDKDPLAVAICGLKCGSKNAKALQLIAGSQVVPSDDHAILSGQYPLTRPLTLVIDVGQTDSQAAIAKEFVRYALCRTGQTKALLAGFFPVDLPILRAGLEQLEGNVKLR